ncbi:MAG: DUF5719 family protein [Acidimicrobiales bacterium]
MRRPSPRLPVVVLVGGAIGGAVAFGGIDGEPAAEGGGVRAASTVGMPAVAAADAPTSTWYCAAGTGEQGGIADHTVAIFNPGDTRVAATVTVYGGAIAPAPSPAAAAEPVAREISVPAGDRVELRLGEVVAAPLVAALVEAGGAVAIEHRVAGPHGRDAAPCASAASPVWHFASGATTRDARDVVVLFNPFPTEATVDVVFDTEDGAREPVRFQGFPVPARSVVGVDIGDDVTRKEHVSMTLRVRTGRVVAERLQQFDGSLGQEGLSLALGAPAAATTWAFADGVVGEGTTERIAVYNPGEALAEVEVRVLPSTREPAPAPQPFRLSVKPGEFAVVDYTDQDRIPRDTRHATVVHATNGVPVVVERIVAQTVEGEDGEEASDVVSGPGAVVAARTWTFPLASAGEAGTAPETETEIAQDASPARFVVFNPDRERSVHVTLHAVVDGRDSEVDDARDVEVPPGGRVMLVAEPPADAPGTAFVVEADAAVTAERMILTTDRLRLAMSVGIPNVDDSVSLARLAAAGDLAGHAASGPERYEPPH